MKKLLQTTLVAALLSSGATMALATASGTSIVNSIDLSYTIGGNTVTETDVASTTFVVDTGVDLIVEGMDTSKTVSGEPSEDDVVLTYRVENLSNETFGFDIDVANTGDFSFTNDNTGNDGTYSVRIGTSATYSAATTTVYDPAGYQNVMDRAAGEEFYVFLVVQMPAGAPAASTEDFEVTATALTQSTSTVVTELTGQGPTGVDIIFDDPGQDGTESDTETLDVLSPDLTATKTQVVVSENLDEAFDCATGTPVVGAEAHIPGACVEYTITVTNGSGATATATGLSVSDTLPANVTYAASDAGDFDTISEASGTVTATLASLAPGNSASFTVRAVIDN